MMQAAAKFLTSDKRDVLELTIKHLTGLADYSHDGVETAFKAVMEESGLKFGKIGPTCPRRAGGWYGQPEHLRCRRRTRQGCSFSQIAKGSCIARLISILCDFLATKMLDSPWQLC